MRRALLLAIPALVAFIGLIAWQMTRQRPERRSTPSPSVSKTAISTKSESSPAESTTGSKSSPSTILTAVAESSSPGEAQTEGRGSSPSRTATTNRRTKSASSQTPATSQRIQSLLSETSSETTSTAPVLRRRAVTPEPPAEVTDFTGYPVYEPGPQTATIELREDRPQVLLSNSIDVCMEWEDEADQHGRECKHVPAWSRSVRLEFQIPDTQGGVAFWRENVPRKWCLIYTLAKDGKEVTRECNTTVMQVAVVGAQP